MDWVIGEASRLGIPDAQVHKEYFQATAPSGGSAFEVIAKKSGKRVIYYITDTQAGTLARSIVKDLMKEEGKDE